MKKIYVLLTSLFLAYGVKAQTPVPKPDSMLVPDRSDSLDFKDKPVLKEDTLHRTELSPGNQRNDSIPLDDRKPKKSPKK